MDVVQLFLRIFVGIAQDQRVVMGISYILHPTRDIGKEWIGNIRNHKLYGMAYLCLESAGHAIAHVPQRVDAGTHPLLQFGLTYLFAFITADTVATETEAWAATSLIVTGRVAAVAVWAAWVVNTTALSLCVV